MKNFENYKIGQKIEPKELIGLNWFNIMFSPTIGYDVNGEVSLIKWDNGKESLSYRYGEGHYNTMPVESSLVVVDANSVAYEDEAWNLLGRDWREVYQAD